MRFCQHCFVGVLVALTWIGVLAQAPSTARANYAGSWVKNPGPDTTLYRKNLTPQGWGPIPYSTTANPYVVLITQSEGSIDLTFPGGNGSLMNVGDYPLLSEPLTMISNHGEWWVKTVKQGAWDGQTLILKATRLTDWWKAARPEDVSWQEAQTDTILRLTLNEAATELRIDTTLSDEKGEAQYRQAFRRR